MVVGVGAGAKSISAPYDYDYAQKRESRGEEPPRSEWFPKLGDRTNDNAPCVVDLDDSLLENLRTEPMKAAYKDGETWRPALPAHTAVLLLVEDAHKSCVIDLDDSISEIVCTELIKDACKGAGT